MWPPRWASMPWLVILDSLLAFADMCAPRSSVGDSHCASNHPVQLCTPYSVVIRVYGECSAPVSLGKPLAACARSCTALIARRAPRRRLRSKCGNQPTQRTSSPFLPRIDSSRPQMRRPVAHRGFILGSSGAMHLYSLLDNYKKFSA